jgi:phosphoribosylanthranilate isomerase
MLKTKVKISKVNNLTDARYFAAMGVDYLGFCCNTGTEMYCAPSRIKEITEWVSGPQFVLEFDGWQQETDIATLLETGIGQAVHFGAFATYGSTFGVPVFKDFILENIAESDFTGVAFPVIRTEKSYHQLTYTEVEKIKELAIQKNVFLDIHFETKQLSEIIENLPVYGIILRGGEEEKTGVKSFEELDSIFELLQD